MTILETLFPRFKILSGEEQFVRILNLKLPVEIIPATLSYVSNTYRQFT